MRSRLEMVLTLAAVLGCDKVTSEASSDTAAVFLSQEAVAADSRAARPAGIRLREHFDAKDYSGFAETVPISLPTSVANLVIRTATASIEVDSLEPAIAQVKELAPRLGGYVANSSIHSGKAQLRHASLEMKVPAQRFDEVIAGLQPIGKVESVNVSAQDVGEEYVDVTARMENARRLERRLIALLGTRTGKLKDVLDVEQALARVREQIERHEGRMRYLRAHTAMSTVNLAIHEPVPVVGPAGQSVMAEAFRQSWRNFVALVALTVQSLGVVIPLLCVALIAWFVTRRWRRVTSQRTA